MPTTQVEVCLGVSGYVGLLLDLYPLKSDVAAITGIAMTEATNRKGTYLSAAFNAVDGSLALLYGEYHAKFRIGSTVIVDTFVTLSGNDNEIHEAGSDPNLIRWLRAMCLQQAPDATALSEINLAAGTFTPTTRDSLHAIGSTSTLGPGATACKVVIKANGIPIPQALVWLTSDPAGTTVVAGSLLTDSNGIVTFMLTVSNLYYLWMRKDGENPILGQSYTATAG